MKIAVIDIGSNSVRLMLWADGTTLYKRVQTTRLGEGLAESGVLSETAMERTARAVNDFDTQAQREGAKVYAFATAAVRSAKNGNIFCKYVKDLCGLSVDVVSGEEEALLAMSGALGEGEGAIIDVGGASTEVCQKSGGKIVYSESLDIGAVRLYDLCKDDKEKLEGVIAEKVKALNLRVTGRLYAVGGTAATLASVKLRLKEYDAAKIQDCAFTEEECVALAEKLLSLSKGERMALDGMEPSRADIIGGGAMLLSRVVAKIGANGFAVSDRDNLEGYLLRRILK